MNHKIVVPFNLAARCGKEIEFISDAMTSDRLSGGGSYGVKAEEWLKNRLNAEAVFLVPSCTSALEFSALLLDIQPGDEVIVPSFTFVSSATAFVLFGAKIIYADVDPVYFNLDINSVISLVSEKTKAIVCVDYAGFSPDIVKIRSLADEFGIILIEDAAQSLGSSIESKQFGSIGHISTISFHETKNVTSGGEGGALIINDSRFLERAHVVRDKGTNRKKYFEGLVDKYSWVDKGSSYLMNEISAAYLYAQLDSFFFIQEARRKIWNQYRDRLSYLKCAANISVCDEPSNIQGNAHIFYITTPYRRDLLFFLRQQGIEACFHYTPLHLSSAGIQYGQAPLSLHNSEIAGSQLLRLPINMFLSEDQVNFVCDHVIDFFERTK